LSPETALVGRASGPVPARARRDDLQGLRAIAVLLVVLNHAGVPGLRGGYVGVDVFFVLSGFLITGLLLAGVEERGRVPLADFYTRRALRILPAAALTLVATDVVAHQLLNFVRARDAVSDSIWASVFAANVHFAQTAGGYFAQGQPPSPVQNFWTLAVEEQFYLVWPLLLTLAIVGARLARGRALAVIAVAGVASFVWSILSTESSPTTAYFSTLTRVWELALGAALAIIARRVTRMPGALQVASGWAGLACIALAAVFFSASTAYPGYAALLPTIGAALVIAAGIRREAPRRAAAAALSAGPLRYVGDRSYALYLWHWPVLVIAADYAGHDLTTGTRLGLVCGAFALSVVSYATFENPIRHMRWRPPRGLLLWPASGIVVLALAVPILVSVDRTAARVEAASAAVRPAMLKDPAAPQTVSLRAAAPLPAVVAAVAASTRNAPLPSPLTPPVDSLRGDFYNFLPGCSPGRGQTSSSVCKLGDQSAVKTIAVFGDSHAQMWMPAILNMALRDSWAVVPFVKDGCIPRTWLVSGDCGTWYGWATARISALRPDVVLIVGSWAGTATPVKAVAPIGTLSAAMRKVAASVIVVGDAPNQTRDPVDCLLAAGSTMATCTARGKPAQLKASSAISAAANARHVGYMDTVGWFCARPAGSTDLLCPLVVNTTITAVDRGHISQTYALELAPSFRASFRRQLFR
jgi:peptidoglycan/LPS O-acetylase OafA/YrhL